VSGSDRVAQCGTFSFRWYLCQCILIIIAMYFPLKTPLIFIESVGIGILRIAFSVNFDSAVLHTKGFYCDLCHNCATVILCASVLVKDKIRSPVTKLELC